MLERFGNVAVVIDKRGVVFQHAALHLEIVDAAREGVCQRLENKERQRLTVIILALDAVAIPASLLEADLGMLIGVRERIHEKSEQASRADVVDRGRHQNRKDLFGYDGFANRRNMVMDGNRAFAEKLLHTFVVSFSDPFNEF